MVALWPLPEISRLAKRGGLLKLKILPSGHAQTPYDESRCGRHH